MQLTIEQLSPRLMSFLTAETVKTNTAGMLKLQRQEMQARFEDAETIVAMPAVKVKPRITMPAKKTAATSAASLNPTLPLPVTTAPVLQFPQVFMIMPTPQSSASDNVIPARLRLAAKSSKYSLEAAPSHIFGQWLQYVINDTQRYFLLFWLLSQGIKAWTTESRLRVVDELCEAGVDLTKYLCIDRSAVGKSEVHHG